MKKILVVILSTVVFFSGCGAREFKRTRILMGTLVKISVVDRDKSPEQIKKAIDKAFFEIENIDRLMSVYRSESEVSRLNRLKQGRMMAVSDELLEVIRRSIRISRLSLGAFDLSSAPLVELWGFGRKGKREDLPSPEEIKESLSTVGYRKIIIDKRKKEIGFAQQGMKIDLGGIAKGYAVDKAIEILKKEKIDNALIDAGGDLYCLGLNAKKIPWVIGIKDPRHSWRVIRTLKLRDRACATSGDYENFFLKNGRRFSHLIDPRTGWPVQNGIISVTVLAPSCLEADALATAVFVLGERKGLKLIDGLAKTEAIVITQKDSCLTTYFSKGIVDE
jgi:thiamine biosynthesis lipoprotein